MNIEKREIKIDKFSPTVLLNKKDISFYNEISETIINLGQISKRLKTDIANTQAKAK